MLKKPEKDAREPFPAAGEYPRGEVMPKHIYIEPLLPHTTFG
jgi:hypothetical protein